MEIVNENPRIVAADSDVLNWALKRWDLTPARITVVYLCFGLFALYLSDVVLVQWVSGPLLAQLQTLKGGAEVLLTGGFIYVLTTTKQAQVDAANRRFQRQREELLVLHRVLRHNLRNDLNVILGHSTAIGESTTTETIRERCDVICQKADRILHYAEQAEQIRRVTKGHGKRVDVDLTEAIPDLVEDFQDATESADVRMDLPESASVRVNWMFPEAVEEVVSNAIEHNDVRPATVDITVDLQAGDFHEAEIRIEDDGPGIPEDVPKILERGEYDQLMHLSGMGLWFVYWVLIESEGRLIIDESSYGGTRVTLRVQKSNIFPVGHVGQP